MGHDITAKRPGVDEDQLYEKFDIGTYGDGWSDRYREYCDAVELAYNRRSAGNPLNQVLYLALGVMDEAYAGCSGNGIELDITRDQFDSALKILETKNFANMTRERNMADDLVEMFATWGATVEPGSWDDDVSSEREFVKKCIAFMDENNHKTVKVRFG